MTPSLRGSVRFRGLAVSWGGAVVLVTFLVGSLWACSRAEADRPSPESGAMSKPNVASASLVGRGAAPEAPSALSDTVEEATFRVAMKPVGPYQAGRKGAVEIVLDAKGGYKCNDSYPYKFRSRPTEGVKFAAEVVGKDAVKLEGKRAVMTVPFTPESAGEKTVAGRFSFSVCTEERCLVEKRDLALSVSVE